MKSEPKAEGEPEINPKIWETPSSGRNAYVKALRQGQAWGAKRMKSPGGLEIGELWGEWWEDGQRGMGDQSMLGVVSRGKRSGL